MTTSKDETNIERVLQAVGARVQPSEALTNQVREAAREQWLAVVAERQAKRRRWLLLATAASIAVTALAVWMGRFVTSPQAILVASIARVSGHVEIAGTWGRSRPAVENQPLLSGEKLVTSMDGRAALALPNGISMRLDHNTRIEFADAHRASMDSGGIYVDSPGVPTAERRLRIETPVGAVQHFGTQYEVRLASSAIQVRVREGRVALTPTQGILQSGIAGEQLTVGANGEVDRMNIDTHGAEWDWVANLAPTMNIDGKPLVEFLSWVGRELGEPVVFANAGSEAEAGKVVLRGSVSGLSPQDALAAVLSTTRLRDADGGDGIVISLEDARR